MTNTSIKLLVVEDDKFLLKFYHMKLKKAGYDAVFTDNGEDAIEKVKSENPDLVILDLLIPKRNGWDVLEVIKKDEKCANIPVIIVSNLEQKDDIQKCLDAGANDYLVKSDISFDEVMEKIEAHAKKLMELGEDLADSNE